MSASRIRIDFPGLRTRLRFAAVDRKTLEIVGNIEPAGIIGPGQEIGTDSKGNLYIAQTTAGMQKLTFKGMSPASQ